MHAANRRFRAWLADEIWDEIVRDSEARLADPVPFAAEALERLFLHECDKALGLVRWEELMATGLWWADDALACLRAVLTAPFFDEHTLGAWVRAHAGPLWIDGQLGNAHAHATWLRDTLVQLEHAFSEALKRQHCPLDPPGRSADPPRSRSPRRRHVTFSNLHRRHPKLVATPGRIGR